MLEFGDDLEARKELAELLQAIKDAPDVPIVTGTVTKFPFIEHDGHACHALKHLAADVRNNRRVPDFKAAGWNWG